MDREVFLNAIGNRLRRPRVTEYPERPSAEAEDVRPAMEATDLCERFKQELALLGASCQDAPSLQGVHELLRAELLRWNASKSISWAKSEFTELRLDWLWDELGCVAWNPTPNGSSEISGQDASAAFRAHAFAADVGITAVDFAVATTGTLVLSAATARPRSVSLLPTVHLALVRASQLVPKMGDALQHYFAKSNAPASAVHFISGPSRTSDIENDHTIGVHGPAAVSVILWRDSAAARAHEAST